MEHFKPPCPEIVVYAQLAPNWPNPFRGPDFVARFWQAGDFLPMIFSGDTPDAARGVSSQFWETETAKIEVRATHLAEMRRASLRARQAPVEAS